MDHRGLGDGIVQKVAASGSHFLAAQADEFDGFIGGASRLLDSVYEVCAVQLGTGFAGTDEYMLGHFSAFIIT